MEREASLLARNAGLGFPYIAPKPRLLKWIDWLLKDDMMIDKEGIRSLSEFELVEALDERGLATGDTLLESRRILNDYIKLSNDLRKLCLGNRLRLTAKDKGAILTALMISNANKYN